MAKRLRLFAGPNGSGKSTLFPMIASQVTTGPWINADEIAKAFDSAGWVRLDSFGIEATPAQFAGFLRRHRELLAKSALAGEKVQLKIEAGRIVSGTTGRVGYDSALCAAFLRERLIAQGSTFSFESVLSHGGKIAELLAAKQAGYRIYLYFVCLDDPEINIQRVATRLQLGGHAVPPEKVRERYQRTLENLWEALRLTDRAYLFDNASDGPMRLIAEKHGADLIVQSETIPAWLETYVIQRVSP